MTYTWQWSNGEIESDTVFNSRLPWFIASSEGDGCVESQARYDLGQHRDPRVRSHVWAGPCGKWPLGDDVPYGFTGETLKRSLAAGDTAGIRSLY